MMENRSFDHYFGTLSGVRGFGDRHPVPLPDRKVVWQQSDGTREILPFHLDTAASNALRAPVTPHTFSDAQAAWGQGRMCEWPRFKTGYAMGHFARADIRFQFALAEAFTLCDAYHCSVATGTDPNRIMFWSGANCDPAARVRRENTTAANSEPNNLRCWVKGALPEPGYTYAGSAFTWPTIPDVLESANIPWRIYQDPNNNWTGAMHGCLAFDTFRAAKPGSAIYENGMRHWSLDRFAEDVKSGRLPAISWILPPEEWSEHPAPSSPIQGAEFTSRVLDALTANPRVWSRTVFLLTFDENDGLFDHAPPPAPPSYDTVGRLAGAATLDLAGLYFHDVEGKLLEPKDTISGSLRPWGLGARVPTYIISPWSRGGWVCSEVFDHTSIGQFLEKRFGITIPAISPWHRTVCGDLTSAFDFANPNEPIPGDLPRASGASTILLEHLQRPQVQVPASFTPITQEAGFRASRALPYVLHVDTVRTRSGYGLCLAFRNAGRAGAVFHVYDRLHLNRIPRRFTVEARKMLTDHWDVFSDDAGRYDLWITAPGGFVRTFKGVLSDEGHAPPVEMTLHYDTKSSAILLTAYNRGPNMVALDLVSIAYSHIGPDRIPLGTEETASRRFDVSQSGNWYDLMVSTAKFEWRFAGRLETGAPSISDPAMGAATWQR
jgi:phospholipase C